jgi:hypothetical protein
MEASEIGAGALFAKKSYPLRVEIKRKIPSRLGFEFSRS